MVIRKNPGKVQVSGKKNLPLVFNPGEADIFRCIKTMKKTLRVLSRTSKIDQHWLLKALSDSTPNKSP
jgi:hypothetical protein